MTDNVQQRVRRSGRVWFGLAVGLLALAGLVRAQWVPFSPPDSLPDRAAHATVYDPVNDGIYMIGGTPSGTPGSHVNLCQRYDPTRDTWETMAPMPTPRGWIGGACVRGRIYIAGGYSNASTALEANEEYTVATNSWQTRAAMPVATLAYQVAVWRDSLMYIMGGTGPGPYLKGTETVQVYSPFTNSWAIGTHMPLHGDMSSAVIVGDTIYIPDAYNRRTAMLWGRMLKGAINPDTANQITWLWGPRPPEGILTVGGSGTVSLHNKVYAFDLAYPESAAVMTGCVYDPATGSYTESLPRLLLEGVTGLNGLVATAREAADELYQVAGTWDFKGGSRYHRLFISPSRAGEAKSEVMPDKRLRASTLFRNGVRIHYVIDRPCRATLTVYDQSGRLVRTLVFGQMQAGSHTAAWDGRDEYGRPAGSGVYFCRLQAGGFTTARKMVKTE